MTFCNGRSKIKFTFKGVFCVCSKYNKLTRCSTYLVFLNYKNVGVRLYQLYTTLFRSASIPTYDNLNGFCILCGRSLSLVNCYLDSFFPVGLA